MTVETASYISQLDASLPASGDQKSEGDDHFRTIKSVLKTQFPNFGTTAITSTAAEVNYLSGVTSAIQTQINSKAALASPALTGTPTAPTAAPGTNTTQLATTAFVAAVLPVDSATVAAASKTTPVDADLLPLVDSAASNALKKLSWSNLKVGVQSGLQFLQIGTGAVSRGNQDKLRESFSATDFGAVGDGSTNNDTAFSNALAAGNPVYVPKASSFYVLTALSEANRALLYGPGTVKVAGVEIFISPFPSSGSANQPVVGQRRMTLAPPAYFGAGAVGTGMNYLDSVRTGGFGQYGNSLQSYRVDAAVPAGQFDVGDTSWVTMTNMTGGQGFGRWAGVNSPAINLGQTYSSGGVIGDEINVGNRWADFGLQTDYGTRYTVGLQFVPDVLPASDGVNTKACTMTSGTPGVVNLTAHGFTAYMGVVFAANGGTLPAAITAGNVYYVVASPTANTFGVSATIGGAVINFATSSTGSPTVLPSYPGSFGEAFGASVWGHQWWVGKLTRPNAICAGGIDTLAWGGSLATLAPAAWTQLRGNWAIGLDLSAATFASQAIKLAAAHSIYLGNASIAGGGTGGFAMSTANANLGTLYSNNYAVENFKWLDIAGAPALGFFGTYPVTRYAGFGTPTNGAVQISFDANSITLANLAKQVAYMTNVLKTYGLFGA